jgi:hypothetical protein
VKTSSWNPRGTQQIIPAVPWEALKGNSWSLYGQTEYEHLPRNSELSKEGFPTPLQ